MDLRQPFKLERQFDLTVCLEVAEHLPSKSAEGLVESLVALAPAVLFSAAIPKQGGTGHVNEQWPDYWRELFRRYGYERSDVIRKAIWNKPGVKFWYRQNIFLFAKEGLIEANPLLREAAAGEDDLLLIHPAILRELLGLRSTLSSLPKNLWQFLKRPISSQNKHSRSLSEK
jgi:hypothetical protein